MGWNSLISWCHHTGNIWWGCTKVNAGCDNCYAEYLSVVRRKFDVWGNDKPRKAIKSFWSNIYLWKAMAEKENTVYRVFIGSMMDIFEKSMPMIDHKLNPISTKTGDLRERLFHEVVPHCPNLIFLFLTKRPSNINKFIPAEWKENPPANVMYGASMSNQKIANSVMRNFVHVKGKKFASIEPQLDIIDLLHDVKSKGKNYGSMIDNLDWVIVGGESGKDRRPFNPDWARSIRTDCKLGGVPFFMKQWDKVKEVPDDLLIQEFPEFHQTYENRIAA